jgi:hypothetical protein
MKNLIIILLLTLSGCSKKELSKQEVFNFLDNNPKHLEEYLKLKSSLNPQKRLLGLTLEDINKARGLNLPFNFSEDDILIFGKKTIIALETSLDCPVLCKNNFKEVKKMAIKNDIGVGLILTKSKNENLDKFALSSINLYPNKKLEIIELIISNPQLKTEDFSKKLNLDHKNILNKMKTIDVNLKKGSDTPLVYINNLTIKGVYRQEAFEEVLKILF